MIKIKPILFALFAAAPVAALPIENLKLPPGFKIDVYAENIKGARSMAQGPDGILFVGTRDEGKVYALVDSEKKNKIDQVYVIAEGLKMPNGVAYRAGALYVAEIDRILRFDSIAQRLKDPPQPEQVGTSFPKDPSHGWKFIRFGPDGFLYVPVGAPCNICDAGDPYAAISRMKPDGSEREIFARGIRNTVGFDWHPQSKELWSTDNGRDLLGDDLPPDELNHASKKGMHFGYPYCHAGDIADPNFGKDHPCSNYTPPARKLGPHVAALGMRFYTGTQFPAKYRQQIFIAEHGSWNRSRKLGYRVMSVKLEGNKAVSYEPFIEGWLQPGDKVWGRPVDIEMMPDGAMLVSDDYAGAIYRVTYTAIK